jgi:hypothetical protein
MKVLFDPKRKKKPDIRFIKAVMKNSVWMQRLYCTKGVPTEIPLYGKLNMQKLRGQMVKRLIL